MDKPLAHLVFDASVRKYWAINKWTRFAEDATEYPTHAAAVARAGQLSSQLGKGLKVVATNSHFKRGSDV